MTQSIRLCISAPFSLSHFLTDSFPTRKAEMGLCDRKHSLGNGPSLGLTGTFDPLGEEPARRHSHPTRLLNITSSAGPGQPTPACYGKEAEPREAPGRSGWWYPDGSALGVSVPEHWGQANSPRGSTLSQGSSSFTASLGETSSLCFCFCFKDN